MVTTATPGGAAAFGHSAGPQSWKQFLHPPREKVWTARRVGGGFEVDAADDPAPRLAFFGVRPCDLRAIQIQIQVLGRGGHAPSRYAARRAGVFIVAVNCTEPGETCFCTSMGTGPQAGPGCDLSLTEMVAATYWAFRGRPRREWQFGAETVEPATAFQLAGAVVMALCDVHPDLGYQLALRMLDAAVRRLQATRIRLLDLYGAPSQGAEVP
jgi:hypothetical protein